MTAFAPAGRFLRCREAAGIRRGANRGRGKSRLRQTRKAACSVSEPAFFERARRAKTAGERLCRSPAFICSAASEKRLFLPPAARAVRGCGAVAAIGCGFSDRRAGGRRRCQLHLFNGVLRFRAPRSARGRTRVLPQLCRSCFFQWGAAPLTVGACSTPSFLRGAFTPRNAAHSP